MIKLFGAACIIATGAGLGLSVAAQLRQRATFLRELCAALAQMQRELSFRLTPLPALMQRLGRDASPCVASIFLDCNKGLKTLGDTPFSAVWRAAVARQSARLTPEELQVLAGLGDVLGRYDSAAQQQALSAAHTALSAYQKEAEAVGARLGKLYTTLGVSAGALLTILLL